MDTKKEKKKLKYNNNDFKPLTTETTNDANKVVEIPADMKQNGKLMS